MANFTGLIQRVNASELYHMACRMDRGEQFGYNGWQAIGEYSTIDPNEWEDASEDAKLELIREYLEDRTSVVCCEDDCIIWQAF